MKKNVLIKLFVHNKGEKVKKINKTKVGYINFQKLGPYITPRRADEGVIDKLEPGIYGADQDENGRILFFSVSTMSDDLIELPNTPADLVVKEIEKFWTSDTSNKFSKYGLIHKRGILMHGKQGCHAKDTGILMYDGSIKLVQDVKVGDLVMGPDSKPRMVLRLARGREKMVKFSPTKGEDFVVNYHHRMYFEKTGSTEGTDCYVNDLIEKKSETFKNRWLLKRTGVEFPEKKQTIPAYILGLWLGDGTSKRVELTTADSIIKKTWIDYATSNGLEYTIQKKNNCENICLVSKERTKNKNNILNEFKKLNLIKNKHIPHNYLTGSKKQRFELLAGLIDTDGHLDNNCYEITQKNEVIANQIVYLCRSLGLAAYKKEVNKSCTYKNEKRTGKYFRINISGEIMSIPVKLKRKKAKKRQQIKDVTKTGYKYEILPEDNYYGFTLDGDNRFLTSDFNIHYNTGKSCTIIKIMEKVVEGGGIVLFGCSPGLASKAIEAIREIQPDVKVLLVYEELDSWLGSNSHAMLSLLDGELQVENFVVLATTNYISRIPARIKNRPSRFASVIEIGTPDSEIRKLFFEHKLDEDQKKMIPELVEKTEGYTIDQLKDVIISVFCFDVPLDQALEKISAMEDSGMGEDDYDEEMKKERFGGRPKQKRRGWLNPLDDDEDYNGN